MDHEQEPVGLGGFMVILGGLCLACSALGAVLIGVGLWVIG